MIHPVPPGTRDVLPDEMRELRALSGSLHATFDRAGFGEVWTPAIEYEDVLRRGLRVWCPAGLGRGCSVLGAARLLLGEHVSHVDLCSLAA